MREVLGVVVVVAFAFACGGTPKPPTVGTGDTPSATPTDTSSPPSTSSSTPPESDAEEEANVPTASRQAAKTAPPLAPPAAGDGAPTALELLLQKGQTSGFPSKGTKDGDCIAGVGLSGQFDRDYDALVAKCGAPTGLKEYTKKVTGKFTDNHHRDTWILKMVGGYCYRMFAVGDASMGNIDVRVQRPNGALLSMDNSKQPVAIIDPDVTWCKHHDREFHIVIESPSGGKGNYAFGVWARPGK